MPEEEMKKREKKMVAADARARSDKATKIAARWSPILSVAMNLTGLLLVALAIFLMVQG